MRIKLILFIILVAAGTYCYNNQTLVKRYYIDANTWVATTLRGPVYIVPQGTTYISRIAEMELTTLDGAVWGSPKFFDWGVGDEVKVSYEADEYTLTNLRLNVKLKFALKSFAK